MAVQDAEGAVRAAALMVVRRVERVAPHEAAHLEGRRRRGVRAPGDVGRVGRAAGRAKCRGDAVVEAF